MRLHGPGFRTKYRYLVSPNLEYKITLDILEFTILRIEKISIN